MSEAATALVSIAPEIMLTDFFVSLLNIGFSPSVIQSNKIGVSG
jgi:hypothetical protein